MNTSEDLKTSISHKLKNIHGLIKSFASCTSIRGHLKKPLLSVQTEAAASWHNVSDAEHWAFIITSALREDLESRRYINVIVYYYCNYDEVITCFAKHNGQCAKQKHAESA